jgi:hypothetical protein
MFTTAGRLGIALIVLAHLTLAGVVTLAETQCFGGARDGSKILFAQSVTRWVKPSGIELTHADRNDGAPPRP